MLRNSVADTGAIVNCEVYIAQHIIRSSLNAVLYNIISLNICSRKIVLRVEGRLDKQSTKSCRLLRLLLSSALCVCECIEFRTADVAELPMQIFVFCCSPQRVAIFADGQPQQHTDNLQSEKR